MEEITSTATTQAELTFPFTTIVGQQRLQPTLILTALSPRIGDTVIRGEKDTVKTITARTLTPFLSGPSVNLPLGTMENWVVGSIDVETVLATGHAQSNPGLLSAADGGILYVDEINLLPNHLVDSALDVAATGRVVAERGSISHFATSKFVSVDMMDPEESKLRPRLLDRFSLTIDVTASRDPAVRAEIAAYRLDSDVDPKNFATWFVVNDAALHIRIDRARALFGDVESAPNILGQIATVCAVFDMDGMRVDIITARTARAYVVWRAAGDESIQPEPHNPIEVTAKNIKVAAGMTLPHRRCHDPFDKPELDQEQLDDVLQDVEKQFRDDQNQPKSDLEASDQLEVKSEPTSQFGSNSGPQELQQSSSVGPKGGRAAKGTPFRRL